MSGLFNNEKCVLVNGTKGAFCVYFMDIVFAAVILLLLIPQVFVVSVPSIAEC